MFKKITSEQIRLGMYVQESGSAWIDNPFWRKSFLLKKQEDLDLLRGWGIREIVIDISKGLDVVPEPAAAGAQPQLPEKPPVRQRAQQGTTVQQEQKYASKLLASARPAITSMFEEVRMGKAVDAQDVLPLVEEITASVSRNSDALISLARLKTADDYTYMHSIAVCALMVALAHEFEMSAEETRQTGLAGLLHDVGKMTIPLNILQKPGPLTEAEYIIVKNHPVSGYELLRDGRGVGEIALDVALHHHEKIDGSGYPYKQNDNQISLHARMGSVCDVYDAITSNRPYKSGWEPGESLRRMTEWSTGHFDQRVFHAFIKIIGIYPVGSLVRMKSDRLGIVIEQNKESLLKPRVKLFFSVRNNVRIPVEEIDLSKREARDQIISHESPAKWGFTANDIWL
jgi:HD-GYP domain-containing protein (c-di-GMP phosphodiesterase class II)